LLQVPVFAQRKYRYIANFAGAQKLEIEAGKVGIKFMPTIDSSMLSSKNQVPWILH
jgi:hypothetical protein